jgi:hybrid cluster-associated redox disulfide protein
MKKVTQNTVLAEILKRPGAVEILAKFKVPCLGCPLARFEASNLKIGRVCQLYGIDAKKLIKKLNKGKK